MQTTREPSATREGWVDITLDLVLTKFGLDPNVASSTVVDAGATSLCFANVQPPSDCLLVAWGSQEQFEAELRPWLDATKIAWPPRKALPYPVTFEVPENASRASLVFDEHRVLLNLQGDRISTTTSASPSPAPTPVPAAGASPVTAGYFMGSEYGVAVVGVSRQPSSRPNWVDASVSLAVLSLHDYGAFAPTLQIETEQHSTCFIGASGDECIRMVWGDRGQFDAVLTLDRGSGEVHWPRGKGWPTTVSMAVPEDAAEASLIFGAHQIPIDLRGMTGSAPSYNYLANYPEIETGGTIYDIDAKTITLDGVEHDGETGDVVLTFSATNNSEATDFFPTVSALGARVSARGTVYDGISEPSVGWFPSNTVVQSSKLTPGSSGDFRLALPRVVGDGFQAIPFGDDRPYAMIFELSATDAGTEAAAGTVSSPVFAPFERSGLQERDMWIATGANFIWARGTGGVDFSSAAVSDGLVFVGSSDTHLYALSIDTGEIVWRYQTVGWVSSSPTVAGGVVYVGSLDDHLYALDAATGDLLWSYGTGGDVRSSPTVAGGVVYVGSGDDYLHAVDADTGDLRWTYKTGGDVLSSPAVADGVVYVGSLDGYLYALYASTGDLLWRHLAADVVVSSPAVADGVVSVASEDNRVYTLDHHGSTGPRASSLRWHYAGGFADSSPSIVDGVIYVGSDDDHLYALNAATGQLVWRHQTGADVDSSPTVSEGVVYVGSDDTFVYALDAATGERLWRYQTDGQVKSSPAVSGGVVYIGSNVNFLYALLASGPR